MIKTVTFPGARDNASIPYPLVYQGVNLVYTRSSWGGDWTLQVDLEPEEVTWSVAPTLPVAVLRVRYGTVLTPGDNQFFVVKAAPIMGLVGHYIKISCGTQTSDDGSSLSRNWFGVVAEAHDEYGGLDLVTGHESGAITLVCYGMEKLLSDHVILDAVSESAVVGVPIDFNRMGPRGVQGNRSAAKSGGTYVFGDTASTCVPWSSKDIIEYLATYQTPGNHLGFGVVDFQLDLPAGIPTDADAPVISAQNATTYSIISQLIDRRRCLMWWVEVDEDTNTCLIKADSILRSPLVGNKITVPANTNQINLWHNRDPLTTVVVNISGLELVDQVVAQGPRIRCVGTFHYTHGSIDSAWTSAQEGTYEDGATPHPAGTPLKRKELRNDVARRSPALENVFSLFQIPEDWDQAVGAAGSEYPLFVDDAGNLKEQNIPHLAIEQSMPLLTGEDYSGSRISAGLVATDLGTSEELKPLVFFRKMWITSAPYKYQSAEGALANVEITHAKENPRLSCHVSVPQNTRSIRVKVTGQPQHAIAKGDFAPIAGEDKYVGDFTWQDAYFTFSVLSQDRTEGRYPEILMQGDAIRRKVIYAGDQFYRDYVAPGTVVGLDEDGELLTSTGGHIPAKDGASDPIKLLKDIAMIAGSWYTVSHYVLVLDSYRLKPARDIPLGALVIKAGGDPDFNGPEDDYYDVNAPITQITFNYPQGGDTTRPASMQIRTWADELEAVEFVAAKPQVSMK